MRGEEFSKNHSEECRERITRLLEDGEVTKALKARARVADRHKEDTPMQEREITDPEQSSSSGTVRKADSDRGGDRDDKEDKVHRTLTQDEEMLEKANRDAAKAINP